MDNKRIEKKTHYYRKEKWELQLNSLEIIALIICVISLFFFLWKREYNLNTISADVWGQFGDFIGGIIGTLIAYISVRLLVKTLKAQYDSNKELIKSNKQARDVYEIQQFNEMFKTLFSLYQQALDKYQFNNLEKGHESMAHIVNNELIKEGFNLIKTSDFSKNNKLAKDIYRNLYSKKHQIISVHFRVLYRLFQLIDTAPIPDSNRTIISKTVRCQLSESELLLLRYNAMGTCGQKMQQYINTYNLLKHIQPLSLLEYSHLSKKLNNDQQNFINIEFQMLNKSIRQTFLTKSLKEKKFRTNLLNENKYIIRVKISSDNKKFRLELVKNSKKNQISDTSNNILTALDMFTENELHDLMSFYVQDFFVYSNFGLFNKKEKLKFHSDIIREQGACKTTVFVEVTNKDRFELISCEKQLNSPIIAN